MKIKSTKCLYLIVMGKWKAHKMKSALKGTLIGADKWYLECSIINKPR